MFLLGTCGEKQIGYGFDPQIFVLMYFCPQCYAAQFWHIDIGKYYKGFFIGFDQIFQRQLAILKKNNFVTEIQLIKNFTKNILIILIIFNHHYRAGPIHQKFIEKLVREDRSLKT